MTRNFRCGRFVLNAERPLIMGIVNLSDDFFSGDRLHGDTAASIAQGRRLIATRDALAVLQAVEDC